MMVGMLACQLQLSLTRAAKADPPGLRCAIRRSRGLLDDGCGATKLAGGFFDLDDFAALVKATLGTSTVRQLALVAIRALGQSGIGQVIVRTALGSTRLGMTSFRIRHENLATGSPTLRRSQL
jgi:hypothetical protein